jgi:hypothetical protein
MLINSIISLYKQYFAYRSHSSLGPYRDKTVIVLLISSFGGRRHTNLADPVQQITGELGNTRAMNS